MFICYDGITLTTLTLDIFEQDVIMDDSKSDKLYDKFLIKGTFIINGQAEPRQLGDPPVSYHTVPGGTNTAFGSIAVDNRNTQALASRPPGQGVPFATPVIPPNSSEAVRNTGVTTDVLADLNPYGAFNYTPGAGSPAFATDFSTVPILVAAPNSPPLTEAIIRRRLTQPRGQLFVFSNIGSSPKELLLQSPGWGTVCDAKNGPLPLYCNIVQSHGDAGTFVVEWAVETYISGEMSRSKTPFNSTVLDPLLSNRFSMVHSLDEDSWLTIIVNGTAIFDTGILINRGINPDNYRPQLFLPVPRGFVRGNIQVEGIPGMEGVNYAFIDRQLPINFPAGPYANATRIEAQHRHYVNCDSDMLHGALSYVDNTLNRRWLRNSSAEDRAAAKEVAMSRVELNKAKAAAIKKKWKLD